jgi:pentapeptide MXKDX repeat protein
LRRISQSQTASNAASGHLCQERFEMRHVDSLIFQQERQMRKIFLAAMCATAVGAFSAGVASAQTTGPAGQDTTKMGTESTMSKDGMAKTQGMSKDSAHKGSMHKDGMKKDSMMKKDEMKK